MKRVIAFICGILVLVLPLFVSADTERVYDPHSLISDTERAELEDELAAATAECGFDIKVVFYDVTTSGYLGELGMLYMISADYESSLAVFLITREYDGYYYDLFLYGEPNDLIDRDTSDEILDTSQVFSNIKSGNLAVGTKALIAATASATGEIRSGRWVGVTVATLVIAALAGGGTALGVYLSYKRKQKSPSYPLSKYASLNLTDASDAFLGSSVVKTRINTSSSRSGGGSRGGGSRGRR